MELENNVDNIDSPKIELFWAILLRDERGRGLVSLIHGTSETARGKFERDIDFELLTR